MRGDCINRRCWISGITGLMLLMSGGDASAAPEAPAPRIALETEAGEIVVEVYDSKAPLTAANFLRLVDGGAYSGGAFYRAVTHATDRGNPKIEVIQGGRGFAAEGKMAGIAHEPTSVTGVRHLDGTISMARGKPGSATSEFFICIGDQPALDAGGGRIADGLGFAAFGRVVAGMDIVRTIQGRPADGKSTDAYVAGQILDPVVRIKRSYRQR